MVAANIPPRTRIFLIFENIRRDAAKKYPIIPEASACKNVAPRNLVIMNSRGETRELS